MLFWKEIFLTTEQEKLREKEEILSQNNVPYKVKMHSGEERQSVNLSDRGARFYRTGPLPAGTYHLYVKKKDVEWAESLLRQS